MGLGNPINYQTAGGGAGSASIPSGLVVLWPSTSAIPSGFVKCDGNNGTVDMRGYYARGTPSGDTINRVYGSATHTHTAAHDHTGVIQSHLHSVAQHSHTVDSHTHTVPNHCHNVENHSHTMSAHSHTGNSHYHGFPGHLHSVANHTHTIEGHCHSAGTLYIDSIEHLWDLGYAEYCNAPSSVKAGNFINSHPIVYGFGPVYGYSGEAVGGASAYIGYYAPSTGTSNPVNSDGYSGSVASAGGIASGSQYDTTNSDGGVTSDACAPATTTDGATETGNTEPAATIDSCALVTGSGSTIPMTRNVEFIMKL